MVEVHYINRKIKLAKWENDGKKKESIEYTNKVHKNKKDF